MKKIINLAIAVVLFGSWGALLFAVNLKNVQVQGVKEPEQLDIDDEDSISQSTFAELIEAKSAENKPYIVARVVSQDAEGKQYVRYIDAHALNAWLFREGLNDHGFREITHYMDPMNRTPIIKIDYFKIDGVAGKAFEYLCSFDELANNIGDWRAYFNTNQPPVPRPLSGEELVDLGEQYLSGFDQEGNPIPVDYPRALRYFQDALNDQDDQWSQAEANGALSRIYRDGYGVEQNEQRANDYERAQINILETLADQQEDPENARDAQMELGHLYQQRLQNRDFTKALNYYNRIANQDEDLEEAAHAKYHLGEIYYEGGHGIVRDYAQARDYFLAYLTVLGEGDYSANARMNLAQIYLAGGDGVNKDSAQARLYLDQVINDESAMPEERDLATATLEAEHLKERIQREHQEGEERLARIEREHRERMEAIDRDHRERIESIQRDAEEQLRLIAPKNEEDDMPVDTQRTTENIRRRQEEWRRD